MHVGATHVSDNFSRGLVHKFYEVVVVHLMEGLVPDLNDTKCNLAHRNTTWNKRVATSKNNPFSTLMLQSSTMMFMIESFILSLSYTSGNFSL